MTNFNGFNRFSIGFEDIFRDFDRLSNIASQYPPHNIVRLSNEKFQLEFAVAGFLEEEIELKQEDGYLYISGTKNETEDEDKYIHRGISSRPFNNKFRLAEHVEIVGASLSAGMLIVTLEQILPESKKPKIISINS